MSPRTICVLAAPPGVKRPVPEEPDMGGRPVSPRAGRKGAAYETCDIFHGTPGPLSFVGQGGGCLTLIDDPESVRNRKNPGDPEVPGGIREDPEEPGRPGSPWRNPGGTGRTCKLEAD